MPDTVHAELRAQLDEERAQILAQLQRMGRAPGTDKLSFDEGFADSGQVTAERGEVDALAGTLLENLKEIEDALAKVDGGTYGLCESCGSPISEARLTAMPSARLCIACASKRK
ncbi:MAG TPA: TraR/DksA C4-type zinc finger protein [Acidimicrobiia bacterium]|jgi:RNA polymerase-binding transcription factor DksA